MRIRTAVAAAALAALAVLGGAGAAAAAGTGHDGWGGERRSHDVDIDTWIKESFNTVVIFGDK
ncbi:hypothetical protein ACIRQP_07095 [Streptomyces sp. NPDC102274]|uniref:hypothetical protein n=1 Tax=Streptomyces sp. NPDC102274 TaxID=3366151 RepID=UPI0038013612